MAWRRVLHTVASGSRLRRMNATRGKNTEAFEFVLPWPVVSQLWRPIVRSHETTGRTNSKASVFVPFFAKLFIQFFESKSYALCNTKKTSICTVQHLEDKHMLVFSNLHGNLGFGGFAIFCHQYHSRTSSTICVLHQLLTWVSLMWWLETNFFNIK